MSINKKMAPQSLSYSRIVCTGEKNHYWYTEQQGLNSKNNFHMHDTAWKKPDTKGTQCIPFNEDQE